MKVLFFTEGTRTSPASRIRVYEYLDRFSVSWNLTARTVSFTSDSYCRMIVAGEPCPWWRKVLEKFHQLRAIALFLANAPEADVVFIQRVLLPVPLQRLLWLLNRNQVYDFDDAVYLGKPGREKRFAFQLSCAARVIAVSRVAADEALARGAETNKVGILPSPVDTGAYSMEEKRKEKTFYVGWIGSPATTGYLEELWPQLAAFAENHPEIRFLFIGARPFETGTLSSRTTFEPWSPKMEPESLCRLDVGLMPLEDDPWCRGKGGFKLIQYMAAGAACLASPVGANLEIIEHGRTGYFVRKKEDWQVLLAKLLEDRELCRKLRRASRQRARNHYDYIITAPALYRLLEEAAKQV